MLGRDFLTGVRWLRRLCPLYSLEMDMPNYRKNKVLLAVLTGQMENLEDALSKNLSPNMPGPSNMTALHMAVLLCQEAMVTRLLQAGAELEARDKNDLTPLGYAVLPAKETPLPQLRIMLKDPDSTALLDLARANIRTALLAAGANWQAKSKKAPTPWERFEHYYPEQAAAMVPQVGPAKV